MADLERIKIAANIISLEAMTPTASVEGMVDRLPNFFSDVKLFVGNLFEFSKEQPAGLLESGSQVKWLKGVSYIDIKDKPVYVPPGLTSSYVDVLHALEQGANVVENIGPNVLSPFSVWLAVQLTDPSKLASLRSEHDVRDFKPHALPKVIKEISDCYKGHGATETTFGKVFARNAEWDYVTNKANSLNERLVGKQVKQLLDAVEGITQNLDILLTRMKEDPVTYRTSASTMKVIATLCTTMAEECEFYSFYRFKLMGVLHALNDSETLLKKSI